MDFVKDWAATIRSSKEASKSRLSQNARVQEGFFRAGGLVRFIPVLDPPLMLHEGALASTRLERLEGYAAGVLARYPVRSGDVMIVASNSGRNAVPIENASGRLDESSAQGLPVGAGVLSSRFQRGRVSPVKTTCRRFTVTAVIPARDIASRDSQPLRFQPARLWR